MINLLACWNQPTRSLLQIKLEGNQRSLRSLKSRSPWKLFQSNNQQSSVTWGPICPFDAVTNWFFSKSGNKVIYAWNEALHTKQILLYQRNRKNESFFQFITPNFTNGKKELQFPIPDFEDSTQAEPMWWMVITSQFANSARSQRRLRSAHKKVPWRGKEETAIISCLPAAKTVAHFLVQGSKGSGLQDIIKETLPISAIQCCTE